MDAMDVLAQISGVDPDRFIGMLSWYVANDEPITATEWKACADEAKKLPAPLPDTSGLSNSTPVQCVECNRRYGDLDYPERQTARSALLTGWRKWPDGWHCGVCKK